MPELALDVPSGKNAPYGTLGLTLRTQLNDLQDSSPAGLLAYKSYHKSLPRRDADLADDQRHRAPAV